MLHTVITLSALQSLISHDHGCLVKDLQPDHYSAPKHQEVLNQLRDSIQRNGITSPLRVVNNTLVDGHHRAMVIMELGIPEIPITYEGRVQ